MEGNLTQRKAIRGSNPNLDNLTKKVNYIGFELEEIPDFLREFEPLNYRVPKVYDETTYKVYKTVKVKDIQILITPKERLDDLSLKYKHASPIFTYMRAEKSEDLEKYAYFLKMINQTNLEDIKEIEKEQKKFKEEIPFEVKFPDNFRWQVYYSDSSNKYFMLASSGETDNSCMFYLLKAKIEDNKNKDEDLTVFIPICNEEYTEKILKKSEISDLENYMWYFTKNWPSIYEVTDNDGVTTLQIIGETQIYDKMTSKYNIKLDNKKDAMKQYKLIKALFILSYDMPNEYKFDAKISPNKGIDFYFGKEKITYETLSDFMRKQAISKIRENEKIKIETMQLKADIQDMQRHSEEQNQEYFNKEREISSFLECKKSFFGRIKYFFKGKKEEEGNLPNSLNKNRMKNILSHDKEEKIYEEKDIEDKQYTVEDIIKICKELEESRRENKNVQSDMKALKAKIDNLDRKIKNATDYLNEIEKHKKSIFEFWKYASKTESKMLSEGQENEETRKDKLKKTFDYMEDIDLLANSMDIKQREALSHKELDAVFASNFVLDGINIVSKEKLLEDDQEKIEKILDSLKGEYQKDIEKIEEKDFDIFGNVSEDKTKIKTLKNNKHREVEKDKFKVLNVNLNTQIDSFIETLKDIRSTLLNESNKIQVPYDIALYKASNEILDSNGFNKFSLNPFETLESLEKESKEKDTYLYKINVPENTNLIFYSNIMFYENNNQTLPAGMDISQEALINMDLYELELKAKEEFNMNVEEDEYHAYVRKVKVYEYDLKMKAE